MIGAAQSLKWHLMSSRVADSDFDPTGLGSKIAAHSNWEIRVEIAGIDGLENLVQDPLVSHLLILYLQFVNKHFLGNLQLGIAKL